MRLARCFILGAGLLSTIGSALSGDEPSAPTLRIATYNINWGNPDLRAVTESISNSEAEIVCLQETTPQSERYLTARFRNEYPHIIFVGDKGKYAAERFGFLSKHPLKNTKYYPAKHGLFGFYRTEIKLGDDKIQIANVHLDPFQVRRGGGVKDLFAALGNLEQTHAREIQYVLDNLEKDIPALIVGDFNSISTSSAPKALQQAGYLDSFASVTEQPETHPSWQWQLPRFVFKLRIDYIFHGEQFETVESKIHPSEGSDHFLLSSVLRMK